MSLDPAHREKVTEWIRQGAKLAEIQTRLASECGVRLTYMEVRLLVDDLKLIPRDAERPKSVPTLGEASDSAGKVEEDPQISGQVEGTQQSAAEGKVQVSVDQLTRPGALVSGKVSFTDGKSAQWYLDQTGRLGLVPPEPGYRPSSGDLQDFQSALEMELSRMGM